MKTAKPEYDEIAEGYLKATTRELRKFAYEPTFLKYLPEVNEEIVLDVGCGSGASSRLILSAGAKKVVGTDNSSGQIGMAEKIKKEEKLPDSKIEYIVHDSINEDFANNILLKNFGRFKVVTAIMSILNVAKTKEELQKGIRNVYNILVPGGSFYAMTVNPILCQSGYNNYGVKMTPSGKEEGSEVKIEISDFNGLKLCPPFTDYYWLEKTYNQILRSNGFQVTWHRGFVSDEGKAKYGAEFWEAYERKPLYLTLTARKK